MIVEWESGIHDVAIIHERGYHRTFKIFMAYHCHTHTLEYTLTLDVNGGAGSILYIFSELGFEYEGTFLFSKETFFNANVGIENVESNGIRIYLYTFTKWNQICGYLPSRKK